MRKFIIERSLPGVGGLAAADLCAAAQKSNAALAELSPRVQWVESYVTQDGTHCIYLAESEADIHEHSRISGFPANKIIEVVRMIDPTTGTPG